jgi:hypothetical protein
MNRLVRILGAKFHGNDETRLQLPLDFLFGTSLYLTKLSDEVLKVTVILSY